MVDDYLLAIDHFDARLGALDARLAELAETEPYRAAVGALSCFQGIDTLTAMLILAELHDFRRFPSPRVLMAYLGLVPGEASSGERHRRGRITKTGTTLVRRLLVEAAWHYRHRARVGVWLARRLPTPWSEPKSGSHHAFVRCDGAASWAKTPWTRRGGTELPIISYAWRRQASSSGKEIWSGMPCRRAYSRTDRDRCSL